MARIAGVDLPREKKVEIGLTYIFGIGRATAQRILEETGVNPDAARPRPHRRRRRTGCVRRSRRTSASRVRCAPKSR